MRVEATSASYLYTASLRTVDRAREITATAAQAANAPQAVEDAPCDESSKPVDFTCMTLKEMYRWLHEQYLQGEMTADESFIFGIAISLACTTRIYESGEIAVLQDVKMEDKADKMPHELSGGEQQRVCIARAILNHPKMIIADEPTGNLDPETADNILQLLREIAQKGTAVIMTTHNMPLVDKYPGIVYRCDDGKMTHVDNMIYG